MNKISKYMAFALAGLAMASCSDDYNDWANPQTNPQEDAITIPGFQATAADAIDFNTVATDSVNTFSLSTAALPEGFTLSDARIVLTPQGVEGATTTTLNTSLDGKAAVAELAQYTEDVYGKRPSARTFDAKVYVDAVKDGQAVLIDAGNVNVVATPKAPYIDAGGYYLTGDMTGAWDVDHLIKFNHSGADVYEDPVFTLVVTTTADNQYWKIIPQGNVTKEDMWAGGAEGVLGTVTNGDASLEGRLTTDDPQAGMIEKAGTYQITLNMMDYTYTIKALHRSIISLAL